MNARHLCLAILLTSTATICRAEDLLVKKGGEYLGWKIANSSRFRTCSGGELSTKGGEVKNSREKCEKRTFSFSGVVEAVDAQEGIVILRDSNGNEITFHLRGADRDQLKDLHVGSPATLSISSSDPTPTDPIIVTRNFGSESSDGLHTMKTSARITSVDATTVSTNAEQTTHHRRMTKE